ncbi:MAG TPA: patatin-like phospholipase family protein [Actinomycetota bacterium]|nr:patatin-like phospholipase family protein [Actinomycetota bacterium]
MAATDPHATGETQRRVGFVLGGGGDLGANEVGMLRALLERGIVPALVVGTSVGALNGAAVAAQPTLEMVKRLETAWRQLGDERIFDSPLRVAGTLIRERTHLHSNQPLRRLIHRLLPVTTFEELAVPFQCVAASIERAAEHWFFEGSLVEPILASSAVPGLLPAVEIGGEHFIDGGIVNSIPIERALQLGATDLYVLHVGRIERPLQPPRNLFQVATVAFEIARRHRFAHDMEDLPAGIVAHILPTGWDDPGSGVSSLRPWDFGAVVERIDRAYEATVDYLDRLTQPAG